MTYREYGQDHHITPRTTPVHCVFCDDGEGGCAFPYYGTVPHRNMMVSGEVVRVDDDPSTWPANFQLDPAAADARSGTYTHCLVCGQPTPYPSDAVESDGGEID